MTNFAKIENDFVTQIIVAEQEIIDSGLFDGLWVLSTDNPIKGCVAFLGCKYNKENNVFYSISAFDSWSFNQETFTWEPPIPYPIDGKKYVWDESTTSWLEIENA